MKFKYDRHDRKELVALKKKYDSKLKAMKGNYEAIIFNPVKYATFIEYGTRKMQPQSMVRKNMIPIQNQLLTNLQKIQDKTDSNQLKAAINDAGNYGLNLIVGSTPVDTGRLKDGWELLPA